LKKEIKIGLAVITGVLLLYFSITWIKSMHLFSANRDRYKVRFSDVTGLKEGDPVVVFGYPSGNVENIGLDGESAVVTITVDRGLVLKSDASAELRVKELMGGKQIALTPGRAATALPKDAFLPGTTTLDFSSAFAKAGEFMDRFDPETIDTLLINISKVAASFADLTDELDTMDVGALADDVSSSARSLNHILADVEQRKMIAKLDESLGKINQLATRADATLGSINTLTDRLSTKTLPDAEKMIGQVSKLLDDSEGMIKDLEGLLKQLQDRNTVAGKLLYDPAMAKDLDFTLDNLNLTLEHIRTKKIFVTMTLSKRQKVFDETPVKINGEKVDR
jgi:phospholipid/cholesterol/gamma-HCH transport system substrate-binding protein